MYRYNQKTGGFFYNDTILTTGYSGHGEGRNNPAMEMIPNVGPTPLGHYLIGKAFDDIRHPGKGPVVMRLYPQGDTNEYGRSGFMIHGDNATHDASEGCIILNRTIRDRIAVDQDRQLEVFR